MPKVNNNKSTNINNLTLDDYIVKCDLIVNGVIAELGADRLFQTDTFNGLIRKLSFQVFNSRTSGIPTADGVSIGCGSNVDINNYDLLFGIYNYYSALCLKYNQCVYSLQFALMININPDVFTRAATGHGNKSLIMFAQYIRKCEEGDQVSRSDIKSIFRLKSMFGYTETPTQINIINAPAESTAELIDKYAHVGKLPPPAIRPE